MAAVLGTGNPAPRVLCEVAPQLETDRLNAPHRAADVTVRFIVRPLGKLAYAMDNVSA